MSDKPPSNRPLTPPSGVQRPISSPGSRPGGVPRPTAAPKAAPPPRPEGHKPDENWIEKRWLAPILDHHNELRHQIRRGRILARKAVRDLAIRPGLLSAEVASESGETHSVKVRMDVIDGPTWVAVVEAIADEAALAADLIRGRMSERLAEIFEEAGHDLFPFDLRDVSSYCSCREDAKVCTGAVATHIHFAEIIQADPMKLLAFRGRDKAWLEQEVRERRGGAVAAPRRESKPAAEGARRDNGRGQRVPFVIEREGDVNEPATALKDGFWSRAEVPTLTFHFEVDHLGPDEIFPIVRALGPGPGETPPETMAQALAPILRTARLKLEAIQNRSEHELEAPPPDVEPIAEAEPLDEVLMAAALRQGQLTTTMVAQALGVSAREAREYLQFLVSAGRLKIIGKARGTKYVPVGAEVAEVSEAAAVADAAVAEAAAVADVAAVAEVAAEVVPAVAEVAVADAVPVVADVVPAVDTKADASE